MYASKVALFIWFHRHAYSVNGFVPREDSTANGASTASAASASATPTLSFNAIPELTACEPTTISWVYSATTGSNSTDIMGLNITNGGVAQPSATAFPSANDGGAFSQSISGGYINATAQNFTWGSVNVTAGWYALVASFPSTGTVQLSRPFDVVDGNNTSCLGVEVPAGTNNASVSNTHPTSSPSSTAGPTLNKSGSKLNAGAIAGGVLGAVALLAAVAAVYLKSRRRQHRDQVPSPNMALISKDTLQPFRSKQVSMGPAASKRAVYGSRAEPPTGNAARSGVGANQPIDIQPDLNRAHVVPSVPHPGTPNPTVNSSSAVAGHSQSFAARGRRQEEDEQDIAGVHAAPPPIPTPTQVPSLAPITTPAPAPIQHIDSGMRMLDPDSTVPLELPPVYTPD
ncbi:hypothetical protein DFH07DRAFT_766983 [Mycena maculata]|uniref:Uncharacterized protein n=1 Tax=Mycena maculata TaxID=230809 RepID=A0AAD7K0V7_9AGAR|nr:hypothetical protein DFH07DRAFT_766983 [Mycena maculata]